MILGQWICRKRNHITLNTGLTRHPTAQSFKGQGRHANNFSPQPRRLTFPGGLAATSGPASRGPAHPPPASLIDLPVPQPKSHPKKSPRKDPGRGVGETRLQDPSFHRKLSRHHTAPRSVRPAPRQFKLASGPRAEGGPALRHPAPAGGVHLRGRWLPPDPSAHAAG